MSNIKDTLTTIFAVVSVIAGAVNAYLQSLGTNGIDWFQLIAAVVVAVVAWFTGRNPDGSKKASPTNV